MGKSALITGITGQDGSYLAELLLEKDYEIYGLIRRTSSPTDWRIKHISDEINFVNGNLRDQYSLIRALKKSEPDEIYNLAAQSDVSFSWDTPLQTAQITGMGVLRMLEAYREQQPDAKFYQASSSEMFGNIEREKRDEETKFRPRSPYAFSKVFGHHAAVNYRESFDLDVCAGIMFNHESPRRGKDFVTRKVTDAVAQIHLEKKDKLVLGRLDTERDWGYAPDYVEAMWKMLQQETMDDYVIATGETHSVKELVKTAFSVVDIDNWRDHVEQDSKYIRPADVESLKGDYSKAKKKLDWEPETGLKEMVEEMVKKDIERHENPKTETEHKRP